MFAATSVNHTEIPFSEKSSNIKGGRALINIGSRVMTGSGGKETRFKKSWLYYHDLRRQNGQSDFFQVNPSFSASNSAILIWPMKISSIALPAFSFYVNNEILIPLRKMNMQGIIRKNIKGIKSLLWGKNKIIVTVSVRLYISNRDHKHTIRTKKNRFLVLLNLSS